MYILCEARITELYKPKKAKKGQETPEEYTVLGRMKGADLKGKRYVPLFPYFEKVHFPYNSHKTVAAI